MFEEFTMITFLLIIAYAYVILLALCTSIAVFGVKLGDRNNKLAQKLYEGDEFLNFLVFRFFINEKPKSLRKCFSLFMWELSGKIFLPLIFITVDNMKSPSVFRSSLTVVLFLLIYILISHTYIETKNKDLFHMLFTALPLLVFILAMIQSVLENKENMPHTWLFIWISLIMLLILTLNIMSINAILYLFENPYIKLTCSVIIIFVTIILIGMAFGSCYIRYPKFFGFDDYELNLMNNTNWNNTAELYLIYKGLIPLIGTLKINLKLAHEYISYLPLFEKIIGYIYPPIFIGILLNGKVSKDNK
jgi:hypothetical protein